MSYTQTQSECIFSHIERTATSRHEYPQKLIATEFDKKERAICITVKQE